MVQARGTWRGGRARVERAIRSAPFSARRGARARAARGGAGFAAETAAARPSPPADEFDAFVPGETQTVAVRDVVVGAGGDAEARARSTTS